MVIIVSSSKEMDVKVFNRAKTSENIYHTSCLYYACFQSRQDSDTILLITCTYIHKPSKTSHKAFLSGKRLNVVLRL